MNSWGIKQRVLFIALLPATFIAALLTVYAVVTQIQDLEMALSSRGAAMVRHLAMASEYAVISSNKGMLLRLVKNIATEMDVRAVHIEDRHNDVILRVGARLRHYGTLSPVRAGQTIGNLSAQGMAQLFRAPIVQTQWLAGESRDDEILAVDGQRDGKAKAQVIGWVTVEFDRARTEVRRAQLWLNNILLSTLFLSVSAVIALRLGRRVSGPIVELTEAVKRVAKGDLTIKLGQPTGGELAQLAQSFNSMAVALNVSKEQLQSRIEQATRELTGALQTVEQQNRVLEFARHEAETSNRAKSEFLANMSHEIRTPINGLLGFLNLLAKTELNQKQLEYLRTVNSTAHGLLTIISDILDLSRIEAGKFVLESVPFNLRQELENTLTLLAPKVHEKGLELILLIRRQVPTQLIGDPVRICQVINNLVSNATKFVKNGEIRVEVVLQEATPAAATLHVAVVDTGIGIEPADQQRIFNVFTQIDSGMTRAFAGTGLGLAIARRLVEFMGGQIGVESELGKGATFWFTIKARTVADGKIETQDVENTKVLVVSPNSHTVSAVADMLKIWKISSGQCTGAQCALAEIAKQHYDLVIVDGAIEDITAELFPGRLTSVRASIPPLILLEGTAKPLSAQELNRLGYAASLLKPPRASALFDIVAQSISRHKRQKSAAKSIPHITRSRACKPLRILLADDNDINRKFVVILLEDIGATVDEATHGGEVVALWRENNYDLILMDIHMPHMDGLKATAKIRALERPGTHIPIVALTADAFASSRNRCVDAGMDDYIAKPLQESVLMKMLEKWCECYLVLAQETHAEWADEPVADSTTAVLDQELGIRLASGHADVWRRSIELFANRLPTQLQQIRQHSAAQELDHIAEIAHQLKGSSYYCGALALNRCIVELASACRCADAASVARLVPVLAAEVNNLLPAIAKTLVRD